jgi:hypothetical protein
VAAVIFRKEKAARNAERLRGVHPMWRIYPPEIMVASLG